MNESAKGVYQDQSALSLKLVLANGPIDPEQFAVFGRGAIEAGPLSVRAAVIGASHCLTVSQGGQDFTELFACVDYRCEWPNQVIAPWDRNAGLWVIDRQYGPVSSYACQTLLVGLGRCRSRISRIHDEAVANAARPDRIGLVCGFPATSGLPTAYTIVSAAWQAHESKLVVETVHEYVNEGLAALTLTEMKIAQGRFQC